jgi:hypothetical protein
MARKDTERDLTSQAINAVIESHGADAVQLPKISDDFPLNQGTVFRVDFADQAGSALYNYVYYDGRRYRVFTRSRDLVQFIARAPQTIIGRVLQVAGVSGFIAVLITMTICYLALRDRQIPDILGHALTAILGFYFATSVYESSKNRN